MTHLEEIEANSIHILRESYRDFKNLVMLWSIGKDSTVLLWLTRKAFLGHVPIPLMHIDTRLSSFLSFFKFLIVSNYRMKL
jgi:sulfate adenylyltransferase subunit 2